MLPHQTSLTKYLFAIFLIVAFIYAFITAQDMLYGPRITVAAPAEGITVTSSVVEITGTVENVSVLRLEGAIISIDENGTFTETLVVASGINTFTLHAEDTFGRMREETLTILYKPLAAEKEPVYDTDLSPLAPEGDALETLIE